jgi:AcrR family transcriptional regulator
VSPRQKLRTPELRAHVLAVAVEVLGQDGPGALTTRRVAAAAGTSTGAVYELFGDKGGLVRAVFFEGFRLLGERFARLPATDDARADLVAVLLEARAFVREHRLLADVMFSQPFAVFDPGKAELRAGAATREVIVDRVRRCIDAGVLAGDPTDIAHVLLAVVQGLIAQETAGWLGTSAASMARRWDLALDATLTGLGPR